MDKLFSFGSLIMIFIFTKSQLPVGEALLNCSEFAALNSLTTSPLQNNEARLRACFAANPYDTTQLPYQQTALPLVLQYDWSLVNLLSFRDGVLNVLYQLVLQWTDPMRQWTITDLPVSFIEIPLTEIWYPRFFAFANKNKYIEINISDQIAHLHVTGYVLVGIFNEIESTCETNLWNFPFDTQTCDIIYLGNRQFLGLNGMDVVLVKSPTTYRFKSFPNDEWEVVNIQTTVINISMSQYSYYSNGSLSEQPVLVLNNIMNGFNVSITLHRFYNYYLVNVIAPIIVLSVLDMLPFVIEDTAREKLLCALTVISGFMFVQGIVANLLPKSYVTPNLALYVSSSLIVSAASVLAEGFCYYVCQFSGEPNRIVCIILKGLGLLLYPSKWIALVKRCCTNMKNKTQSAKVSYSDTVVNVLKTNSSEAIASTDSISTVEMTTAGATKINHKESRHTSIPDATLDESRILDSRETRHTHQEMSYSAEWLRVAHCLNRLFALMHLVAFFTLIAIFVIPIVISDSISPTNYNLT